MSIELEDPVGPWTSPFPGGVGALASWTTSDGSVRLASSGTDGIIRIWDPDCGEQIGNPLVGHTAAVWYLTVWSWSDQIMLVSTGEDETIRRWDVVNGMAVGEPIRAHRGWVRA